MKRKIFNLFFLLFASLLSGVLLVSAFPVYDLWWLAWIGLVPLLIAIAGRSPKQGFLLSFVCSVIYFPGIFYWMLEVPGYTLFHHIILGVYLGSYFGFFGLIFCLIFKRFDIASAMFSAPFIWVSLEYIRSNLLFMALPLALLGHSQYENLPVIQIASLTGAYGISFILVLVNAALACAILICCRKMGTFKFLNSIPLSKRGSISIIVVAASLTGLTLVYGHMTLSKPINDGEIRISIIQGNIGAAEKWDKKYVNLIMQTYTDLSNKASKDSPELIVWPEAATPGFVLKKIELLSQMISLIRQTKTHYLIGSSEYPKFQKTPFEHIKMGNTALFFSPKGKVIGQYLKIRLVPFREYIPYDGIIPWPNFIVSKGAKNSTISGKEVTLFELDKIKFGSVICWESLYPELFRKFVKKGANLIINLANEGWFGETACPYQFLSANIFRAVENRISIVRATNTGISCFIDPHGRIIDRLQNNNKDIYVKGYLTKEVKLSKQKSFYTIYGDIWAYMSLTISLIMIGLSFLKGEKEIHE